MASFRSLFPELTLNNYYLRPGRGGKDQCFWDKNGFNYRCKGLGIRSLMMESLDKDTESRRLSPIGIGTEGFIDLINGPQVCEPLNVAFYSVYVVLSGKP